MHTYTETSEILEEDVECEAWIAPPYLAGIGDSDLAFRALEEEFGWTWVKGPGHTESAHSPCERARVTLAKREDDPDEQWDWEIHVDPGFGAGEEWRAEFEHETPVEVVRATATAIARDLAGDGPTRTPTGIGFTAVVDRAGWPIHLHGHTAVGTIAPNGLLAVTRSHPSAGPRSDDWTWHLRAGEINDLVWAGRLSASMPRHVVAAAMDALTDPQPVLREARWLPTSSLHLIRVRPSHWVPTAAMNTAAVPPARAPRVPTGLTPDQLALAARHHTNNPPTTSTAPPR
ncbi:DUF317 domain-containing protein [Streptomyces sp. SID3343]|uniref:DUF317 domain-containing protein n=1 Tax=Streptomyces sp. SID3343 TaxID=2690260 RepID=UPI00136B9294|nr:DUF317 domain-containing protein [Streptomyces sp. SID3343]MYW03356.1 DUF317 domain-containing protein [Streptomyces sp. SID3343]MYW06238.1 DUF317 domain-containing protein [Streptomyces sp. SID3343]